MIMKVKEKKLQDSQKSQIYNNNDINNNCGCAQVSSPGL